MTAAMLTLAGKIAWGVMVVAWYVLRIPFERKARKARIGRDEMKTPERIRLGISLAGLGVIPGFYATSPFLSFADYAPHAAAFWLGLAAAAGALVMFRLTHKALGRYWSVSLQLKEDHKLITTGVYARIRHPMYTAFWLMALAQALLLPNWIAGLSGLLGFGTLYLLRVGEEERLMREGFGADYDAYMARTGRLWPKL